MQCKFCKFTNAVEAVLLKHNHHKHNMKYPKDLRYTFETVRKVFMELGTDLSARVRSLKNKLLQ